jgi:hypothetical protein
MLSLERLMILQPLLKQILDLMGKAHDHIAGKTRARLCCRFKYPLHLVVIEDGDHRRKHYTGWDPCMT